MEPKAKIKKMRKDPPTKLLYYHTDYKNPNDYYNLQLLARKAG